ncbi:hypothetical protein [Arthrobacter flavus]|uniref:Integral membrane protein n=1 Tax=Arthrobacter flavus TaxID=95172 RepID=A0ABW4Q4U0_9MICC
MPRQRWVTSVVLAVLAAGLVFATVPALYLRTQVLATDRYVETIAPLAADPAIQAAVTEHLTERIVASIDVEGRARHALTELTRSAPLAEPLIADLVPVIVEQTHARIEAAASRVVTAPQFQILWVEANREAHQRLLGLVTGEPTGVASLDENGAVTLSTGEIIAQVKERLIGEDATIGTRIPEIDAELTLFQSPELVRAGQAINVLDRGAVILTWLAALGAVAAIAVAPAGLRLRVIGVLGFGVALAMAVLAVTVGLGREYYLNAIPPDRISPAAAQSLIDYLLAPLQVSMRIVFVVALLTMLVAFLLRRSSVVLGQRRGNPPVGGHTRGDRDLQPWQHRLWWNKRAAQAAVVVVAMVVLVLWQQPTASVALWTTVGAGLALVAVELLSRSMTAQ